MDLSSEQLIAVVLALVSGILFLFRRSDKVIWHQFDNMKLRQEHTNTKLIDCEKNHALVHEQILQISIKLERELGKKEGAGEVADRVIAHIDGRARS